MKSLSQLFFLIALLGCPAQSWATSDGGTQATLLGTAHQGKWAVIAESFIQEDCAMGNCVVYVVELEKATFERRFVRDLPSHHEEKMGRRA